MGILCKHDFILKENKCIAWSLSGSSSAKLLSLKYPTVRDPPCKLYFLKALEHFVIAYKTVSFRPTENIM